MQCVCKIWTFFCLQLRYYDSEEDTNCKGFIELFEVQSVQPIRNVQGAPKKADENAFFEVGNWNLANYKALTQLWDFIFLR